MINYLANISILILLEFLTNLLLQRSQLKFCYVDITQIKNVSVFL